MKRLPWLLTVVLAFAGCGPEAIELVRFALDAGFESDAGSVVDAGSDAGTEVDAATGLRTCNGNDDCSGDQYCVTSSCGSKLGTCQSRPGPCGGEQAPVCGCDGVMYFNDCLRRQHGVSMATEAACMRLPCGEPGQSCPASAFCWRLASERSGGCRGGAHGGTWTCWVVPSQCGSGSDGGDRYDACDGTEQCVNACEAIQSEALFVRAGRCPQGPRGGPTNNLPGP